MIQADWDHNGDQKYRVFFVGEPASFTHGWTLVVFEAPLRCVQQLWDVAYEARQVQ